MFSGTVAVAAANGNGVGLDPVASFTPVGFPDFMLPNGASLTNVAAAGNFAVFGGGNVSGQPIIKVSGTPGSFVRASVTLADNALFAASYGGTVGALYPLNVATNGALIAVSTNARGLVLFDADLTSNGFVAANATAPFFGPMVFHGNKVWGIDAGGAARLYSVELAGSPQELTALTTNLSNGVFALAVAPTQNLLYLGHVNGTLSTVDTTAAPTVANVVNLSGAGQVRSLLVVGTRLFVGRADFGTTPRTTRLEVYDITVPTAPVLGDTLPLGDFIVDHLAYNAAQDEVYATGRNTPELRVIPVSSCTP